MDSNTLVKNDMKAGFYYDYGPSTVLIVGAVSRPIPKKEEIVVRILACAMNPIDVKLRQNSVSAHPRPLPKITGSDFCGHVVDISMCEDPHVSVGDLVYGMLPFLNTSQGSCAEYIVIEEKNVAAAPTRSRPPLFTEAEVASLPLASLTVLQAFEPFVSACNKEATEVTPLKEKVVHTEDIKENTNRYKLLNEYNLRQQDSGAVVPGVNETHIHKEQDSESDTSTDLGYPNESIFRKRTVTHPLVSTLPFSPTGNTSLGTEGKTVLIQGGAGSLGCIAIQYCKHYLGMKVITTCQQHNATFCQRLGADITIDYIQQTTFLEDDTRLQSKVDVAFDPFSYYYRERTLNSPLPVLAPNGWYLEIPSSPHSRTQAVKLNLLDPLRLSLPEASLSYSITRKFTYLMNNIKNISYIFRKGLGLVLNYCMQKEEDFSTSLDSIHRNYHYRLIHVQCNAKYLRQVARLARAGIILPVVSKKNVFPFTTHGIREAHDKVETGHVRGKVTIAVSPPR